MEIARAEDVTLEGLCGGAVRLTIDVGPDFQMTDSIAAKLRQIDELFAEVGREAAAAAAAADDEEVAGFGLLGGLSISPSPLRTQEDLLAQFGATRQISNQYGCHCVAVGKTADNR